ncbi:unnamed protein product [Pieris macdunnoughi]|uniref:Uncharacterized protein n=1 Tax=Pieris macdunnoughi TaxID=345717 RepID=A0A821UUZ7_9NEOP|nr:unnamed protein product [Pieris macdunnoughi]
MNGITRLGRCNNVNIRTDRSHSMSHGSIITRTDEGASDKPWAGNVFSEAPWDDSDYVMDEYHRDWKEGATRKIFNNVLKPEARIAREGMGNVWSGVLGAMLGAGTVLIIAVLLFIFRRPKKLEKPSLTPMEVSPNRAVPCDKMSNFDNPVITYSLLLTRLRFVQGLNGKYF